METETQLSEGETESRVDRESQPLYRYQSPQRMK